MSLKILLPVGALTGLLLLAPAFDAADATPAVRIAGTAAAPVEFARYHRRRVARTHPHGAFVPRYARPDYGPAPSYGGFANRQNGSPPDNEFDPTRPYGGQAAITAPPGTAAFEEQANERRYFCEFSPSRC